jgi:Zinc knuckle
METSNRPNRKNAVICEGINGIPITDCLIAIADIVSGLKISHASRISNGRVCVYLQDQESVNAVTEDGGFSVNGQFVSVRKYISGAQKVLLSNVLPDITNHQLVNALSKYGKMTGEIRDVNIGCDRPDLAHIKSFRRVAYLIIDDVNKFPQIINVKIENEEQWTVFLTLDDATCYKCKQSGHLARNCATPTIVNTPAPVSQSKAGQKLSLADVVSGRSTESTTLKIKPHNQRQPISTPTPSTPSDAEIIVSTPSDTAKADTTPKDDDRAIIDFPPLKRTRLNSKETVNEEEVSAYDSSASTSSREDQQHRDDSSISKMVAMLDNVYTITPSQLEEFLKKSRGLKRPAVRAVEYTTDAVGLIKILTDAKKHASTYNLKRRLERTIKSVRVESVSWPEKTGNIGLGK